jgi:hypothetical protein
MNSLFKHIDPRLLMRLNLGALVTTSISEALVIYFFIQKTSDPYIERWKYLTLLGGLILVSLLLLVVIGMFFYFLKIKQNQKPPTKQ